MVRPIPSELVKPIVADGSGLTKARMGKKKNDDETEEWVPGAEAIVLRGGVQWTRSWKLDQDFLKFS
ncbi:UNVERIFIED_CONTAM: hypothetical protein Sindi_0732600, partial [Sesamum indicum]